MTTIVTRNGMRVAKKVTCLRCGFQEEACHCWKAEMSIAMAMREVRKRRGLSPVTYYSDRRGYIHELD